MASPQRVPVNKQVVKQIADEFGRTVKEIEALIRSTKSFDRRNRTALMSEINAKLSRSVGVATSAIEDEVESQYAKASKNAAGQLSVPVSAGIGAAGAATIALLVGQFRDNIEVAATNVSRNAQQIISVAARQEIQVLQVAGELSTSEASKLVAPAVERAINENGLFGIIDRGGNTWSLDRYAEMSMRTQATEVYNTAVANKNLEAGIDLVKVTDTGSEHKECVDWEGVIVSITGKTDGFPSLEEAKDAGLFHPNCTHALESLSAAELEEHGGGKLT